MLQGCVGLLWLGAGGREEAEMSSVSDELSLAGHSVSVFCIRYLPRSTREVGTSRVRLRPVLRRRFDSATPSALLDSAIRQVIWVLIFYHRPLPHASVCECLLQVRSYARKKASCAVKTGLTHCSKHRIRRVPATVASPFGPVPEVLEHRLLIFHVPSGCYRSTSDRCDEK